MASRELAALLSLALAACGNYSTEDVAFIEAMPTRSTLHVDLPGQGAAAVATGAVGQAAGTCGPGTLGDASGWAEAKAIGDKVNGALDWILRVVDVVRTIDPTHRQRDSRTWGPYPDRSHPGFENRIVVSRSFAGDRPTYVFVFEARDTSPATGWLPLIRGEFVGGSARTGSGTVTLLFTNIRALRLDQNTTDPTDDIPIGYDRTAEPWKVSLQLPGADGFGLVPYTYVYERYGDGRGAFDYAVRDASNNLIAWRARFTASGAGRGDVRLYVPPRAPPAPPSYAFAACWDASSCYSAVYDLANLSGLCTAAPCVVTWPGGCAAGLPP